MAVIMRGELSQGDVVVAGGGVSKRPLGSSFYRVFKLAASHVHIQLTLL